MSQRVLAGRYELHEPLGRGLLGEVWRAHDRTLDRTVAVRLVHEHLTRDADVLERLRDAARASAGLAHPSIATVHDVWEEDGRLFVASEFVEGVPLSSLIREEPLPVAKTARIGRNVLQALAHAHERGVVHGDVRPEDVLVAGEDRVKLGDFGLVEALDERLGPQRGRGSLSRPGAAVSPEVAAGGRATPLSDVYGVGCLLHTCLAGEPPYGTGGTAEVAARRDERGVVPVRRIRAEVGEGFEGIILKALATDPADRFSSATEMDAAIAALALDHVQDTPPYFAAPATTEVVERERIVDEEPARPLPWVPNALTWLLVGLVVGLLILLAVLLATREDEPEPTPTPVPTPVVTQAPPVVPPPVVVPQPQPTVILVTPVPTPAPTPTPVPPAP